MRQAPEETIPILDLGPCRTRAPNAACRFAEELCWARENIGFCFITNHSVDQTLIDATFAEAAASMRYRWSGSRRC